MISLAKGLVMFSPPEHMRQRQEVVDFARCEGDDWQDPRWGDGGAVHNWRNYAPPVLRRMWPSFTDEQKQTVAFALQLAADGEQWE